METVIAEGSTRDVAVELWRKSSFSTGGECVALMDLGEKVDLRNSNFPGRTTLRVDRAAIAALIAACRSGELDDV